MQEMIDDAALRGLEVRDLRARLRTLHDENRALRQLVDVLERRIAFLERAHRNVTRSAFAGWTRTRSRT